MKMECFCFSLFRQLVQCGMTGDNRRKMEAQLATERLYLHYLEKQKNISTNKCPSVPLCWHRRLLKSATVSL